MKKEGKWFYTGHMMNDGKTPRTVYVTGKNNIEIYLKSGLKPMEEETKKGEDDGNTNKSSS